MSIPNLHTTINYKELIYLQANKPTGEGYVKKQKETKQKTYTKKITKK